MGQGVTEVDQQAIAEVLGNKALTASDHLGAGLLIGPHHLAPLFRVELARERGRVHEVAEQDRELATVGLRRTRGGWWGFDGGRWIDLGRRHLHRLGRWRTRRWGATNVTDPDRHVTVFVHSHALGFDELLPQIVEDLIV
jgi:hypothetical protein